MTLGCSHLLARRGLAERIGNLLGQLNFTDDQLQRTEKGLKDAGVPMPNFGAVGRELAKEINEEPEVEIESEEERKDSCKSFIYCVTERRSPQVVIGNFSRTKALLSVSSQSYVGSF